MRIVDCTPDDVGVLARMNKMLIEDEKAETGLSLSQLEERMAHWIGWEYRAFLFFHNEKVVGYALGHTQRSPVYLRQFFICRDERRKGYGKQAFGALLTHFAVTQIDIDVYV